MMLAGSLGVGCSNNSNGTDAKSQGDLSASTKDMKSGLNELQVILSASGINFDDWAYSTTLHKLLVPGALTGNLYMVDDSSGAISTISMFDAQVPDGGMGGFNPPDGFMVPDGFSIPDGGFHFLGEGGITSVAEDTDNHLLYLTDHSGNQIYVVDPVAMTIKGKVPLKANPDYVRYVHATQELWVTEPGKSAQIEVLSVPQSGIPTSIATISVPKGPQYLYIDNTHGVAYTNQGGGRGGGMGMPPPANTLAFDVTTRAQKGPAAGWASGCARPSGFAADEPNNLLFIACSDNGAVSIDVTDPGNGVPILPRTIMNGSEPSTVSFNSTLRHLYVPGPSTSIVAVSKAGVLTNQGIVATPYGERNAIADDMGNLWVQQQYNGSVLRIQDPIPSNASP
jgi:hypothetical protein